jgi:hypothetical protein
MTQQFTRTLALRDYIAANWLYQRKYWLWSGLVKVYGLAVGLFVLMMLVFSALDEPLTLPIVLYHLENGLILGLVMVVAIIILSAVKMLLTAKRYFREMSLERPMTYEFDDQGFRAANDEGTANLAWDRLYDFVQDRSVLLLRRTRRLFFILPKSQFTRDELVQIVSCMRKAGVRER